MKIKRHFRVLLAPAFALVLAVALFSAPTIYAQDFSKYRDFSLGMTLAPLLRQLDAKPEDARVIHQSPRLIQELTWWPIRSYRSSAPAQPLDNVVFSFLDGRLYSIAATYDLAATKGLTDEDMIQTFSAKYGIAARPDAAATTATVGYGNAEITLAHWEDGEYSVTLLRSAYGRSFDLLVFSKPINNEADASIAEALKQEHENAPRIELARVKKESDDLETVRQANLKSFQP